MKKLLIVLICGLFSTNLMFSQSIERGMWQLQNPGQIYMSSILSFKEGEVTNSLANLTTNQMGQVSGTYNLSGNTLVVVINNIKYIYSLEWINKNKFTLSNDNGSLIYSQSNTNEDHYFKNFMNWNINNSSGVNYNGGINDVSSANSRELCYTCQGVGRCKVCGGSGTYSAYGFSSDCSACNKSGKCWHCKGSGYQ